MPHDPKAAANAAKLGQTFISANRTSKAAQALRGVADAILALDGEREAAPAGKAAKGAKPAKAKGGDAGEGSGSLLGRFDLKKLLPSKAKAGANA